VIGFSFRSDLLQRSGQKGGGGYFTTHTRAGLADTLVTAIDDILLRSATFTAATVPTSRQSFGNAFFVTFLEPRPESDLWVGHLQAFKLSENFEVLGTNGPALDANGLFIEPRAPFWDSQSELHDPNQTRNLLTTKSPSRALTAANITATDLSVTASDLTLYPNDPALPFSSTEALADAVVNWVHGRDTFDKDRDLNSTELREAVLGDIFHSNPLAIAGPPPFLSGEAGFGPPGDPTSFFERYALRQRVIYAGANDGMLHGFKAGNLLLADNPDTTATESAYYDIGTGDEIFGYVPGFLLPRLKELPQRRDKPFYVDGTPSVADVWLPSNAGDVTKDPNEWATALVVGMRNGGDGYLALDVTDPNATVSGAHSPYPKLLWELSDPNEDLGRTWSEAVITRVKIAGTVNDDFCGPDNNEGASVTFPSGSCREVWVAIFAGGFRDAANPNQASYVSDPNSATWSKDSKSIYIVRMDTGAVLAKAVYSASDPVLRNMLFAMPSQPAVVDLNFDGFADLIYVGDLGGQIWKWDISAVGQTSGTPALVPFTTWPVGRFFAAPRASNGHYRSIFNAPSVSLVNSRVTLAFGTGERTDIQYATTAGVDENRFYVISDPNALGPGVLPATPYGESNLTNLTGSLLDPNLNDMGFYLVGQTDEKFVTDAITFGGFVIATSYTPDQANSAALCMARGLATLYVFSVVDGKGFYASVGSPDGTRRLSIGGGLPTSPTVVQANMTTTRIVVQTSDGRVLTPSGPAASSGGTQVIFWREIF
jgi:type IV pilus assembly protein PilY1